jgi:hypothetical protein
VVRVNELPEHKTAGLRLPVDELEILTEHNSVIITLPFPLFIPAWFTWLLPPL